MPEADALCTDQCVQISAGGSSDRVLAHDQTRNQPPEILTEIFRLSVSSWRDKVELPRDRVPWILGHVCMRWRQILWNSPFIWNKIVANCSDLGHYYSTTAVDGAGGYIVRKPFKSAVRDVLACILERIASPLSLEVWGSVEHVSDIIFAHPERFSTLVLDRVSQDTLFHLLGLPPNTFAALKEISLTFTSIDQPIPNYATSPFSTAPKFTKVEYRTQEATYIPSLFFFPYSRLEAIHVETMELPLMAIHDLWRGSPCLMSCAFELGDIDDISTLSHVTIPALRSLKLKAFFNLDWNAFLCLITVPSLERVDISTSQISPLPLMCLISRSRCLIKEFNIYEEYPDKNNLDDPTLHSFFRQLPEMTHIRVCWTFSTSAIHSINNGALPRLISGSFSMNPEVFSVFLDIMDVFLDHPGPQTHSFKSFTVYCHEGPGFRAVRQRYRARYVIYDRARKLLCLTAIGGSLSNLLQDESGDEEDYGS